MAKIPWKIPSSTFGELFHGLHSERGVGRKTELAWSFVFGGYVIFNNLMNSEEREKIEVEKASKISQILNDYKELEDRGIVPNRYTKEAVQAGTVGGALLVIGILVLYFILTAEDIDTDYLVVGLFLGGGILFGGIHSIGIALKNK